MKFLSSIKLYTLLFLLYILPSSSLTAQIATDLRFTSINTNNGLSSNNVNDVLRDNRGFLWIATNDGLCRYDSPDNFKIFYAEDTEGKEGLKSNNISTLFIDSKDNLWVGTRLGGLSRYHLPTKQWKTFLNDPTDKNSLSNNEVLCIIEDSHQNIWVGTEDGLNLYLAEKEQFIVYKGGKSNPNSLSGKAILSIMADDKGWLWIGTWGGGIHLLIPSKSMDYIDVQFRNITPSKNSKKWNVWKIYQDKEQRYWVGTFGNGLFLMQLPVDASNLQNTQNWQPTFHQYVASGKDKQTISANLIKDILQDSKGRLWVATVYGLNHVLPNHLPDPAKFNTPSDEKPIIQFNRHIYNPTEKYSFSHNEVNAIFEDYQGLIWFGTFGGLCKHNWFTNQFSTKEIFDFTKEMPNGQNIYVDNDRIAWIGTGTSGLVKYDLNSGEIRKVNKNDFSRSIGDNVRSVYSPNDMDIYIATYKGLSILNRKTGQYKNFPTPKWFEEQNLVFQINSMHADKYNKVWLGTGTGLFTLDLNTGVYENYKHDAENPSSISDNSINSILEDTYGNLWVATFNGLNVSTDYGEETITFQNFKTNNASLTDSIISSNRIMALKQVEDELYIGTTSGLSSYNLINNKFSNLSLTKNRFWIQSIEFNNAEELWMSTTEGIISFDIKKQQFNHFEQADGLGDLTFRKGSSSVDKFGNYYFGSRQGITVIQPTTIKKNTNPPPVYITEIEKINANSGETINCVNQEAYILDYDDYYLSIDFTALNYNRPQKNKYAYKLEGFEAHWTYPETNTPVVYTNLEHGDYTFRVKAANNDGLWNEEGASLKIIKKPAFWETWWFYLLSILSILFIIFSGNYYHTNNIRQRNLALKKYNEDLNEEIEERKRVEEILKQREELLEAQSKTLETVNLDLKRSNTDLEHFAYAASHDLKEPLRTISSFTNLLTRNFQDAKDKDTAQYVYFIQDGVTRMTQLIQNLLDYARAGKNEVKFTPVKLNDIVGTKLFDLSELIKEKNAQVKVGDLPIIYCEKEQISMLFHNLISNAIKFNKKDNKEVRILSHEDGPSGFWKISVADNGIGIKPKYQEKIFEIFQRLHTKSEFQGTGIGLALCKKIVTTHKGKIELSSKVGAGTTFFILLPRHPKNKYNASVEKVAHAIS